MSDDIRFSPAGDRAIMVYFENTISEEIKHKVSQFNNKLISMKIDGIDTTVPAYNSLLVCYNPLQIKYGEIMSILHNIKIDEIEDNFEKDVVEIPVLYGGEFGEDIKNVAEQNGLTEQQVIDIHTKPEYLVYMLGFTPGFPYLGGMDEKITTPRLETPRVKIEAGSVGIAGKQTGIYPIASPGGWQIIGRTPLKIYNSNIKNKFLIKAGQYIKFIPINKYEFNKIKKEQEIDFDSDIEITKKERIPINGIVIRNGGFLTTIQDLGREKYQEYGVPVSGAMDIYSCKLANILVGNDIKEAVIETTMIGPTIEFEKDNVIAITGGDLGACINDVPIPMYKAKLVEKGDILKFTGVKKGCRAYIAFGGGLEVDSIMDSKATYIKAKIGGFMGRKLQTNDRIGFLKPTTQIVSYTEIPEKVAISHNIELRVVLGPEDDCFTSKGIQTFLSSTYTITNEFDRMGCRLEGEVIEHKKDGNIISNGIAFGAIQVPSHGKPIIMLADRQTVGGYTKIANVISIDLPKLAQAMPNDKVTFKLIAPQEAQKLYIEQENRLQDFINSKINLNLDYNYNKERSFKIKVNDKEYDVKVTEVPQ